ncbi:hypothetical protein [Desulfofustis glycolicus]|uniref:Uncharacterized protein n=1 Tax=Desulfofustis glycolicus DSM 9705 TaxID=1121409 RepID=A0A1M5YDS0_9BACT|nr:hypothetical protein [Desulfofustis glycolicus]MCB2216922.1 hypothetical protein [Desulfobulbaceae bacterium]SHI10210.1 hypothetical protein SAMN02745124_03919 [Desulfofustis glycolicus DSM 9705]
MVLFDNNYYFEILKERLKPSGRKEGVEKGYQFAGYMVFLRQEGALLTNSGSER